MIFFSKISNSSLENITQLEERKAFLWLTQNKAAAFVGSGKSASAWRRRRQRSSRQAWRQRRRRRRTLPGGTKESKQAECAKKSSECGEREWERVGKSKTGRVGFQAFGFKFGFYFVFFLFFVFRCCFPSFSLCFSGFFPTSPLLSISLLLCFSAQQRSCVSSHWRRARSLDVRSPAAPVRLTALYQKTKNLKQHKNQIT